MGATRRDSGSSSRPSGPTGWVQTSENRVRRDFTSSSPNPRRSASRVGDAVDPHALPFDLVDLDPFVNDGPLKRTIRRRRVASFGGRRPRSMASQTSAGSWLPIPWKLSADSRQITPSGATAAAVARPWCSVTSAFARRYLPGPTRSSVPSATRRVSSCRWMPARDTALAVMVPGASARLRMRCRAVPGMWQSALSYW
jgi:hypothetical protein